MFLACNKRIYNITLLLREIDYTIKRFRQCRPVMVTCLFLYKKMCTFASDNGFSVEKMDKENIKALRSETEALRMLIVGIEKRLEQQKILLDQLLEEVEQEEEQPHPIVESAEVPQPTAVEPVVTPKEESSVVTVEEQPQP